MARPPTNILMLTLIGIFVIGGTGTMLVLDALGTITTEKQGDDWIGWLVVAVFSAALIILVRDRFNRWRLLKKAGFEPIDRRPHWMSPVKKTLDGREVKVHLFDPHHGGTDRDHQDRWTTIEARVDAPVPWSLSVRPKRRIGPASPDLPEIALQDSALDEKFVIRSDDRNWAVFVLKGTAREILERHDSFAELRFHDGKLLLYRAMFHKNAKALEEDLRLFEAALRAIDRSSRWLVMPEAGPPRSEEA